MRIFIIAGEESGDVLAAQLAQEILQQNPAAQISGLGGEKLQQISAAVENWLAHSAVLGIWEVLQNYGYFRQKMAQTEKSLIAQPPDAVILVDYPGFNLRLAQRLKKNPALQNSKLIMLVAPQVWAWKKGRAKTMAQYLDLLLCIFPFEPQYFVPHGLQTIFVGHPLVAQIKAGDFAQRDPDLIGIFPGSRSKEISRILPPMLDSGRILLAQNSQLKLKISAVSKEKSLQISKIVAAVLPAELQARTEIAVANSRELMQICRAGLVASGTATLQAALSQMPYALVYRVAPLTYFLGKILVKIPFIGIANIIAKREIVREFIQNQATGKNLAAELSRLLVAENAQAQISDFAKLREKLQPADFTTTKISSANYAAREILALPKN